MKIDESTMQLIFFTIGYAGIIYSIFTALRNIAAKKWKKVRGKITTSNIQSDCDNDGCTYEAKIHYDYTYKGISYTSNKIAFGYFSNSIEYFSKRLTNRFRYGSTPLIYINPRKPSMSVLVVGIRPFHIFNVLFFSIMIIITSQFAGTS